MNIDVIETVAVIDTNEIMITNTQSAIDCMMTIQYETNCKKIAINKEAFLEDFFILSSGIAGEILQKFINYQIKIAIYGDFSKYTSKPLKDFIHESNQGNDIFFVATKEEAIKVLEKQ